MKIIVIAQVLNIRLFLRNRLFLFTETECLHFFTFWHCCFSCLSTNQYYEKIFTLQFSILNTSAASLQLDFQNILNYTIHKYLIDTDSRDILYVTTVKLLR